MPVNKNVQAAVQDALLEAAIDEAMMEEEDGGPSFLEKIVGEEASTQAFVEDAKNAAVVTVYNQHDGTPSRVLVAMLKATLKKRFPRMPQIPEKFWGKQVFRLSQPKGLPTPVKVPCMLHADSPRRPEIEAAGLASVFCTKFLASEMDADLHARRKHPAEFRSITERTRLMRETEDRDLRRQEVEAMKALAAASKKE